MKMQTTVMETQEVSALNSGESHTEFICGLRDDRQTLVPTRGRLLRIPSRQRDRHRVRFSERYCLKGLLLRPMTSLAMQSRAFHSSRVSERVWETLASTLPENQRKKE